MLPSGVELTVGIRRGLRQDPAALEPILVGVLVYVAAQLLIGAWVARRVRTEDDYLVAGRRLGLPLASISIFATWFGAETCVGASGAAYETGLGAHSVEPFAYGACLLLMGLVFAAPLWRTGITTLGDLFRRRFGARVETIAAIVLVPTSLFWASAQIHAFGKVLSASSTLEFDTALHIAALIVVVYTTCGGLMADVVTDVLQGGVLVIGLVILSVAVVIGVGGIGEAMTLAFDVAPVDRAPSPPLGLAATIETWALPVLGSVTAQEVVSRSLASRSAVTARSAGLVGGSLYLLVGLMPVFLGLIAAHRHGGLEHSDTALATLAMTHLPTIGYVIFAGALVSAILSTVDSALLAAASILSRNLLLARRHDVGDRTRLLTARVCVVGCGLLAWQLARSSEDVMSGIEDASGFGSAGVVVCVVFALFSRRGGALAAGSALVAGTATWIVGRYFATDFELPYLASLGASILGYAGGMLAERAMARRVGRG